MATSTSRKAVTAARTATRKATTAPARKTATGKQIPPAAPAARTSTPVYTIHSMGEYDIDTRITRTQALNEDEARRLTSEIQRTAARLWLLVTEAHDRKAHLALGYENWADYCKAELGISESRSYQFLDTGHVMKALAAAGVDVEQFNPPPTRVVARVKDRLVDVRKAAVAAIKEAEADDADPLQAVDTAIRALAREPRKGEGNGNGAASSAGQAADADDATEEPPEIDEGPDLDEWGEEPGDDEDSVPCPACAGTGKVTQSVAEKLLALLRNLL